MSSGRTPRFLEWPGLCLATTAREFWQLCCVWPQYGRYSINLVVQVADKRTSHSTMQQLVGCAHHVLPLQKALAAEILLGGCVLRLEWVCKTVVHSAKLLAAYAWLIHVAVCCKSALQLWQGRLAMLLRVICVTYHVVN